MCVLTRLYSNYSPWLSSLCLTGSACFTKNLYCPSHPMCSPYSAFFSLREGTWGEKEGCPSHPMYSSPTVLLSFEGATWCEKEGVPPTLCTPPLQCFFHLRGLHGVRQKFSFPPYLPPYSVSDFHLGGVHAYGVGKKLVPPASMYPPALFQCFFHLRRVQGVRKNVVPPTTPPYNFSFI